MGDRLGVEDGGDEIGVCDSSAGIVIAAVVTIGVVECGVGRKDGRVESCRSSVSFLIAGVDACVDDAAATAPAYDDCVSEDGRGADGNADCGAASESATLAEVEAKEAGSDGAEGDESGDGTIDTAVTVGVFIDGKVNCIGFIVVVCVSVIVAVVPSMSSVPSFPSVPSILACNSLLHFLTCPSHDRFEHATCLFGVTGWVE